MYTVIETKLFEAAGVDAKRINYVCKAASKDRSRAAIHNTFGLCLDERSKKTWLISTDGRRVHGCTMPWLASQGVYNIISSNNKHVYAAYDSEKVFPTIWNVIPECKPDASSCVEFSPGRHRGSETKLFRQLTKINPDVCIDYDYFTDVVKGASSMSMNLWVSQADSFSPILFTDAPNWEGCCLFSAVMPIRTFQ